jgi:hypothetical protein
MATSKSNNGEEKCIGGVFLFSGRPNPEWEISEDDVTELMEIWNTLIPLRSGHQLASKLGYQGCFLRCPNNREWIAFKEVVTLRKFDAYEYRKDRGRKFEKKLLSSAPRGVLPPSFHANRML